MPFHMLCRRDVPDLHDRVRALRGFFIRFGPAAGR
jgi:hypothetical protein